MITKRQINDFLHANDKTIYRLDLHKQEIKILRVSTANVDEFQVLWCNIYGSTENPIQFASPCKYGISRRCGYDDSRYRYYLTAKDAINAVTIEQQRHYTIAKRLDAVQATLSDMQKV